MARASLSSPGTVARHGRRARADGDAFDHIFVLGVDLVEEGDDFGKPLLARIAERCDFNLDTLRYEYPAELVPKAHTAEFAAEPRP